MSMGANTFDPYAARGIQSALDPKVMARVERLGMSPRQQELNRLWAAYRGVQYEARKVDWDGTERMKSLDMEAIATAGFVPPGFYDANASQFPLKFRRPSTPYHLRRVVVDRFTGLLFSNRRHPALRVEGDSASEDYVRTLAEVSRLWPGFIQARTYGGSMGTSVVGFQFVDGKPIVEVDDPRWCYPTFEDRHELKLASLEKRYIFPMDERDPETGLWVQRPYWYRRIIDAERDVLFKPVPVGEGEEPEWEVEREVVHGFGFCPRVWIQNSPVQDDIDGDPDCTGIDDLCDSIDALLSQANAGIIANCDPTLRIVTDADLDSIRKGSKNAIKLPAGSSADYMEMTGTGPKAALELADRLRELALEVAQCVLDNPTAAMKTATEVERSYASMLARADVFREQYGEHGVKPLMEMMVKAVRSLTKPRMVGGSIVRQTVELPPRISAQEDGTVERTARELGEGGVLNLVWGPYFAPTLDDATKAVQASVAAKGGGLIDSDAAVGFAAPYFNIEDSAGMARRVRAEAAAQQQQRDALSMGMMDGMSAQPTGEAPAAYGDDETVSDASAETTTTAAGVVLNGIQVRTLKEVMRDVASGELKLGSAVGLITTAFPHISPEQAKALLVDEDRDGVPDSMQTTGDVNASADDSMPTPTETAAPKDIMPAPAPVEGAPLAQSALNGAQVTSLLEVINSVASGNLPRESGVQLISHAFSLPVAAAEAMMGEVGRSFVIGGTKSSNSTPGTAPAQG